MSEERTVDLPFASMRSTTAGLLHNLTTPDGESSLKGHPGKSIDIYSQGKSRFSEYVVKTTGDLPTPEQWAALAAEHDKGMRLCESPIERNLLAALLTGAWQCLQGEFPRIHEAKNYSEVFPRGRVVLVPQMALLRYRVDIGIVATTAKGAVLLIGIECDGKEFHQDAQKDAARDAYFAALGVKMFRISGRILNEAPITISDMLISKIEGLMG